MKRPVDLDNDEEGQHTTTNIVRMIGWVESTMWKNFEGMLSIQYNIHHTQQKQMYNNQHMLTTNIRFSSHVLEKTGDRHFSPVAVYNLPPTNSCLVLMWQDSSMPLNGYW